MNYTENEGGGRRTRKKEEELPQRKDHHLWIITSGSSLAGIKRGILQIKDQEKREEEIE